MKIIRFFFCCIAGLLSFSLTGQNIDTQKIDQYIDVIERNNRGIGSIGIYKNDKAVYKRNFGQSKVFEKTTADGEYQYHIGSITKLFTAVMIFQLVDEGKLQLSDRLIRYFPDVDIMNFFQLSIRDVLEHSSGLDDFTCRNDDPYWLGTKTDDETIMQEIESQGIPHYGTGKKKTFFYSSTGYYFLAKLVEQKRKMSYNEAVKKYIINKIKLNNTYSYDENPNDNLKSYQLFDQWQPIDEFDFSNVIGVGDMVSTTDDLAKFIYTLFRTNKLIFPESLSKMMPTVHKEKFGRGLMYYLDHKKAFYGHTGGTFGTFSAVYYNDSDKLAIVYAINGAGFSYYQMFESILSIIYHRRYQLPEFKTVVPQKEDLDKYVGTYYSSEFDVHVDFTQKNNRLFLKPAGCYPITVLDAYDNRTFKSAEGSVTYEFHPDKNEVTVHQVKGSFIMVKQTESESEKLE